MTAGVKKTIAAYENCTWRIDRMPLLEFLRKADDTDRVNIVQWLRRKHADIVHKEAYGVYVTGGGHEARTMRQKKMTPHRLACNAALRVVDVDVELLEFFGDECALPIRPKNLIDFAKEYESRARRRWRAPCGRASAINSTDTGWCLMCLSGACRTSFLQKRFGCRHSVGALRQLEVPQGIVDGVIRLEPLSLQRAIRLPTHHRFARHIPRVKDVEARLHVGTTAAPQVGGVSRLGTAVAKVLEVHRFRSFEDVFREHDHKRLIPECCAWRISTTLVSARLNPTRSA